MEGRITFLPSGKTVQVRPGTSVLRAARGARIHLATRCGGNAGCLMCKVQVDPEHAAALTPPSDAERRKLGPLLDQGMRLACQAKIRGDVVVQLPKDPLKAAIRKQLERQREEEELW
ncbi:2Fe-2S iron-sulfur cluster-binding protein [Paenibacillus phoenicis]|uniref:2Fe-2S iron-sulfur cluster-binding protein n=1 Tax=Paenibacillus phoenicis TaxID=554117 RepID=A0ABU5PIW8_9BACL|nr:MULTISPECIES: 2Fe-2S iron-sulfur cluster-binding protein [Paenibacillus]EES72313.1 2Fe-2S iron-sulfur cluster binding domain protein [Paenibacillus sp. oral taxon 786 str. D14]MCT2196199.1 2Fe-2S iron-sulfur cluster-binding protein [Paenibacillus sp. p3-SID1389]MEA3569908.1 2Fe-2S iron-sulfur cluster-binding protein [Paenibacillus phoenicis]MEC2342746.1 2Fe-2S iron-sulfur cluster-binding protein [Paenibacillus barengoltzii]